MCDSHLRDMPMMGGLDIGSSWPHASSNSSEFKLSSNELELEQINMKTPHACEQDKQKIKHVSLGKR